MTLYIILAVLFILTANFFAATYSVYRSVYYRSGNKKKHKNKNKKNTRVEEKQKFIAAKRKEFEGLCFETLEITSFDGTILKGRYFNVEGSDKAVIIFHGYHSNVVADGCLITKHCLKKGINVLAVHQRAHGESGGNTITFGIKERLDCQCWVDHLTKKLGNKAEIVLMGVSMGGSTVMMASDLPMPNVKGIISDCGFSSPENILKAVIERRRYPKTISYFIARTGAILYGKFDPEEHSALKALSLSDIPLTIIHGDGDDYVPCSMAYDCFNAAKTSNKELIIIKDAPHAHSYFYDTEAYEKAINRMLTTQ